MLPLKCFLAALGIAFALPLIAGQSTEPAPRDTEYEWMSISEWYRRHADDVEKAATGTGSVVFAGDSITQGWEQSKAYQEAFSAYDPVNLGIGGDRTENLLWRLQNSATGKLRPKLVVLLIGVNNFGQSQDTPRAVYLGVKANIKELKRSFPDSKILTLGVFPWGETASNPNRQKALRANQLIAKLADDRVTVLDIGETFLESDGSISRETMADFLHPTEAGYQRMTDAILPTFAALMQESQ